MAGSPKRGFYRSLCQLPLGSWEVSSRTSGPERGALESTGAVGSRGIGNESDDDCSAASDGSCLKADDSAGTLANSPSSQRKHGRNYCEVLGSVVMLVGCHLLYDNIPTCQLSSSLG